MEATQDEAPGAGEKQEETVPLSQGEVGDNSFVITEVSDPQTIGRYRIIRLLGKGGFGRGYLAHDDDLNRPVAIKVPNKERISRPRSEEHTSELQSPMYL